MKVALAAILAAAIQQTLRSFTRTLSTTNSQEMDAGPACGMHDTLAAPHRLRARVPRGEAGPAFPTLAREETGSDGPVSEQPLLARLGGGAGSDPAGRTTLLACSRCG